MEFLAWPGVVLILGVIFIFVFKQPISRFIDRTQKVGKTGIETGSGAQTSGVTPKLSAADELLKTFDNTLLVQKEEYIRNELEKLNLGQGPDRDRVLIRLLAALSIGQSFERTYYFIWGSQLGALELLNEFGESGLETEILRPSFEQAAAREPERYRGDTFERWLAFMEVSQLINKRDGKVYITVEGKEFLKYIVHQGYTLYKRG